MDASVLILVGGFVGLFIGLQLMRSDPPQVVVVEIETERAWPSGCLFLGVVIIVVVVVLLAGNAYAAQNPLALTGFAPT